jgi:DNA (cytosine-5)-methyltransferase 1
MNSVDLFSGLGATALALGDMYGSPICNPAVVCDCCAFSRALLKERAEQGYFGPRSNSIHIADDVRSLTRHPGDGDVQILTAGYCCQDLSTMGTREGLRGSRSGLIFEIPRLADEI